MRTYLFASRPPPGPRTTGLGRGGGVLDDLASQLDWKCLEEREGPQSFSKLYEELG